MGFRQSLVGAVFATVVAAVLVSNIEVDAPLAGFTLSFTIQYTRSIIWTIRMYSQLEMNMNAVERVIDYSELETEDQGGFDPPAAWPAEGRLEVSDLEVRYAPDLPSVLKGLTFNVEKGQRIGIVGRTGKNRRNTLVPTRCTIGPRADYFRLRQVDIYLGSLPLPSTLPRWHDLCRRH